MCVCLDYAVLVLCLANVVRRFRTFAFDMCIVIMGLMCSVHTNCVPNSNVPHKIQMKQFQRSSFAAVATVFINRYHGRLHRSEDALIIVMNAVAYMQKKKNNNNGSFEYRLEFKIIPNIVL